MHQPASTIIFGSLLAFCVTAVYFDLRFGKIPNFFNALGFISGILISDALLGPGGVRLSLGGAMLGLAILILPFLLHMVGGGDVKFLIAAGSIVGWHALWPSFLTGAALGGAIGIVLLIAHDRSIGRLRCRLVLWRAGCWRSSPSVLNLSGPGLEDVRFPYSMPMSIGLIAVSSIRLCIK
jgi:Flp pilus assembly protein protease CpaA